LGMNLFLLKDDPHRYERFFGILDARGQS